MRKLPKLQFSPWSYITIRPEQTQQTIDLVFVVDQVDEGPKQRGWNFKCGDGCGCKEDYKLLRLDTFGCMQHLMSTAGRHWHAGLMCRHHQHIRILQREAISLSANLVAGIPASFNGKYGQKCRVGHKFDNRFQLSTGLKPPQNVEGLFFK